jgi:hypothetical protein
MEPVETEFFDNEQENQYGAGHTNGKSRNIDQGEYPVFTDVSEGNSKKIPPHHTSFVND